jgi:hypothetical protein
MEDIIFIQEDSSDEFDDNRDHFKRIIYRPGDILYLETKNYFSGIISIFKNLNKSLPMPQ